MPVALAESHLPSAIQQSLHLQSKSPPSKPSNTIQSLLCKLETQPKSDKVLITRSTLANIQKNLADATKKGNENSMSNDLLFKSLADVKARYEQALRSHASERKRLEQGIKELKESLLVAKQTASIHTSRWMEKLKADNRQLELDLYKERISSKQLQAQLTTERQQKEILQLQLLSNVQGNARLKRLIESLSFQE